MVEDESTYPFGKITQRVRAGHAKYIRFADGSASLTPEPGSRLNAAHA
jgi:hypothetical protein